ncbi:MAG TPA: hypothetical protein VF193_14120 [Steroidobacter sp.]
MGQDIASSSITIRVRDAVAVVGFLLTVVIGAATGYFSLRSEIAEAKNTAQLAIVEFEKLMPRVARIECLIEQQTQYQIYGVLPTHQCEQGGFVR